MGLFTTKVSIEVPPAVPYTSPVEVRGNLQWFCPAIMCPPLGAWLPYAGATVEIIVDGVKSQSVTTDDSGNFSCTLNLPIGIHDIEAYYPGSWKDKPSHASAVVKVMSPEEYKSYEFSQDLTYLLLGAAVPIALAAIAAIIRGK